MDSQEDSLNSARLREFKEYLLKFGDEFEASQPGTVDDSDGDCGSNFFIKTVDETLHEILKVGKHAETLVHASASGHSRWNTFRQRLAKQTGNFKVSLSTKPNCQPHRSASTSRRDWRKQSRADLTTMPGSTPPLSGNGSLEVETQEYSQHVFERYFTKRIGTSQPQHDRDGHPGNVTSGQPGQMADQQENDIQIDLVTEFQQSQTGPDGDGSNCIDSSVDHVTDAFSSSPGMVDIRSGTGSSQQAKTPISHWAKQFANEGSRSEATTPALPVNPFARAGTATATGTVMGLSQVFQATQGVTPLRPKLVSDTLTERPSPDIYNNQQRTAPAFISSALQNTKTSSDLPVATSPQNSESERDKTSRKGRSSSVNPGNVDDFSEDDMGPSVSPQIRARIRRRQRDEEIRKSLSEFKVRLPERETKAETKRGRRKNGDIQRAECGQLSGKSQEKLPMQSEKRATQLEETETTGDEDETSETEKPGGNVMTVVPSGHEGESSDVIESDGVQVPMTTTRQLWKSGTRPSLEDSPLSFRQQNPRMYRTTRSSMFPSHLPPVASSGDRESIIVKGTPVENIASSQQPSVQGNQLGDKTSLAPHPYIVRSSAELASVNSESQSTIVQAEANNRPNMNFTFEGAGNSSVPQAVAGSGDTVASSVTGRQEPEPQTEGNEEAAHRSNKETPDDRVHNQREPINSQQVCQLRSDASCSGRREDSTPGGHSTVPASTDHSYTCSHSVSQRGLGEGDAVSLRNKTSSNAKVVIPETSPAGGSWPLSSAGEPSPSRINSLRVASRPRANSPGNMANGAGGDDIPETTNASKTSTIHANAAVPGQRTESNLAGKQTMTALGRRNGNQGRAVSVPLQGSSEVQDQLETASTGAASEDYSINSSPLYHFKKRRKGNDGNSAPIAYQQPHLAQTSNIPGPIDATTASSGPGDIIAESRKANAKRRGRPSTLKETSEAPRLGGGSKLTSKSPGHGKGQQMLFNEERSPAANPADSPISTRQLANSRPEVDINDAQTRTGHQGSAPPAHDDRDPSHDPLDTRVTHPNRVFALFKGVKMAYWPATCISSVGSNGCTIQFDDGNTTVLDSRDVCSLDLKLDDVVKVDLPNMRQKNYVIVGFRNEENPTVDTQSYGNEQYPRTDIYGHTIVILKVKTGSRLSSAGPTSNDDTTSVPLAKVYIVLSNWLKFKDRTHTHSSIQPETETRSRTPPRAISTPLTPPSRSRRVRTATPRHEATVSDQPISGLFRNMAFAVSYGDNEVDKKLIIKHITMNGGKILDEGLHELFDMDSTNTPQGQSHTDISGNQGRGLELKSEWRRTGFACVLSDQHSRREKYIQALALGLPCLAGRWIEDCVRRNAIINWEPYILPSGESAYLRNAVRNRILPYYSAETARLSTTLSSRLNLLEGKSVLILRSGETAGSRKTFFFLIHALGASRIHRVANIEAANTTLTESLSNGHTWGFLYTGTQRVNSNDLRVRAVSAGMKRKRAFNTRLRSTEEDMSNEPTKIIDNEYIVQSLILGRLLDE